MSARETVWEWPGPPRLRVWREEARSGDRVWLQHVLTAGDGEPGVVVVAERSGEVLLVEHPRPAVGRVLWELPRGHGEPDAAEPAVDGARELAEETGYRATRWRTLGRVWADSGILGTPVVVLRADVVGEPGEADDEVVGLRWVRWEDLRREVAAGGIEDGLTLAALALVWAGAAGS